VNSTALAAGHRKPPYTDSSPVEIVEKQEKPLGGGLSIFVPETRITMFFGATTSLAIECSMVGIQCRVSGVALTTDMTFCKCAGD